MIEDHQHGITHPHPTDGPPPPKPPPPPVVHAPTILQVQLSFYDPRPENQ